MQGAGYRYGCAGEEGGSSAGGSHRLPHCLQGSSPLSWSTPSIRVLDPHIFLSDPDPWIRNPELRIRISIPHGLLFVVIFAGDKN